jgi:hypothetical protein
MDVAFARNLDIQDSSYTTSPKDVQIAKLNYVSLQALKLHLEETNSQFTIPACGPEAEGESEKYLNLGQESVFGPQEIYNRCFPLISWKFRHFCVFKMGTASTGSNTRMGLQLIAYIQKNN